MPIFHDPDPRLARLSPSPERAVEPERMMPRRSEESIRTEFCDGFILDGPTENSEPAAEAAERDEDRGVQISDRGELIERIKRGESPTWVPNRAIEKYLHSSEKSLPPESLVSRFSDRSPLLPAAELVEKANPSKQPHPLNSNGSEQNEALSPPQDIERPKSALHAGDFTQSLENSLGLDHSAEPSGSSLLGTSPTAPWYKPGSSRPISFQADPRFPPPHNDELEHDRRPSRNRAPSLSSYTSYILKPPTSPLVQQSNNTDLDFSVNTSTSPTKSSRRHTLPPHALHKSHSPPRSRTETPSRFTRPLPSIHRESTYPYQIHQARRSLTSNWSLQASTSPQTPPFLRSRRPSFSSEASPLQHASMVGSYEESILRGRMSTGPSKPLDFTAQIGVLGKGNCKPKYPAHVTIPFPAVFYSWNGGLGRSQSIMDDEPSPYVGLIDLEHSLPPSQPKESRRRRREALVPDGFDGSGDAGSLAERDHVSANLALRKREKRKRRTPSPRAPSGGAYRIPQQGQLQIMIKNPNKTAVKLFLVPYDLQGMDSGTKTFIRQRCYSAGPIIENPITSHSPSEPGNRPQDVKSKPTLRYLIHLNICCPSRGRFYLFHNIRVVFANRVPDNKEKLQNEIQLQEPRYSPYKPGKELHTTPISTVGARLSTDLAQRRRSVWFGNEFGSTNLDAVDGIPTSRASTGGSTYPFQQSTSSMPPIPPLPFNLVRSRKSPTAEAAISHSDAMDLDSSRPSSASGFQSPLSDKTSRLTNNLSSSYRSNSSNSSDGYNKLSKGDAGYGGRPGTPELGEGLLARRLKGLGVQRDVPNADSEFS